MTKTTDNEKLISDLADQESLLNHASDAARHGFRYLMSRASLAVTEAKVAIISLVFIIVLALVAVIVLCATWALACYALSYWIVASLGASVPIALLVIIVANTVLLAIVAVCARNLVGSITMKSTLDPSEIAAYDLKMHHSDEISAAGERIQAQ